MAFRTIQGNQGFTIYSSIAPVQILLFASFQLLEVTRNVSPGKYLCHFSVNMLSTDWPVEAERLGPKPVLQAHWSVKGRPAVARACVREL